MTEKGFLFLSYRSSEADFALRLAADLKNAGIAVWMDRLELRPGDDWVSRLQEAVNKSSGMISVLSPAYCGSRYCRRELSRAVRKEIKIVPILLQDVSDEEYPLELERTQYIDFRSWRDSKVYDAQIQVLVQQLSKNYTASVKPEPDAEEQYLNCLIADLETRRGVLEQIDPYENTESKTPDNHVRPQYFVEHWSTETPFDIVDDEGEAWLEAGTSLRGIGAVSDRYPRFVIVGDPGAGKTMTLVSLTLNTARERQGSPDQPLPFFVKLATWKHETTVEDFFRKRWELDGDVIDLMARGKVIPFCDGLNEISVSTPEKIAQLRAWLEGATAPHRAVFTCRADRYTGDYNIGLPAVQAQALDMERIRSYVLAILGEKSGGALLRRLLPATGALAQASDEVRQLFFLARMPFFLNTLMLIHTSSPNGELPHNMGALANRLIGEMWERSQAKGIPGEIPFEALAAGLEKLAYAMLSGVNQVYAPVEVAKTHLGGDEAFAVAISSGFLERDNGSARFHHQLVQDFFAAQELARIGVEHHLSPPQFDHNGARVPGKWDRVIVALSGCTIDPDALIRLTLGIDPDLAAMCLASGINVSETTRAEVIVTLTNQVSFEGRSMISAARVLVAFDANAALPLLLGAMRTGAWADRREAALALRGLSLPMHPSLGRALDQASPSNSTAIASHIRKMGDRALPTLLGMLQHHHWYARCNAAWGLGELGDPAATPDLVDALRDRDKRVASEAADALSMTGDPAAVEPLYLLAQEQTALGKGTKLGKSAINALGRLGEASLPRLIDLMGAESNPEARRLTSHVWKDIDALPAMSDLLALSYDENPDIRAAALEALAAVTEDGRAVKRLIDALNDSAFVKRLKRHLNDFAAEKLVETGIPQAERAAKRWRADEARQRHTASSAETVTKRLKKVSRTGEVAAAASAPTTPPPVLTTGPVAPGGGGLDNKPVANVGTSAMKRILIMLDDADEKMRLNAVHTLATMQGDTAISALIKALGDFEAVVSDAAVDALVMHGAAVVDAVRHAVRDTDLNRRAGALEVLCRIPAAAAIPELIAALDDTRKPWLSDRRICDLAAGALERVGTAEAMKAVADWRAAQPVAVAVVNPLGVDPASAAEVPPAQPTRSADDPSRYPEILADMLQALRSEDWGVREETAKDLREFVRIKLRGAHDPAVIDPLTAALGDPDWVMRWAVVEALAWVGDPGVVPLLLVRLEDENWMVRVAAIRAIQEIGDRTAASRLTEMFDDPNSTVREAAAEALGKLGDHAAIPTLTLAALEREALVRFAAVEALLRIGGEAVIAPIANALNDEEPMIRFRAVMALGELGYPQAVSDLTKMLTDEAVPQWQDRRVCDAAAESLTLLGTPEASRAVETWQVAQELISAPNAPTS